MPKLNQSRFKTQIGSLLVATLAICTALAADSSANNESPNEFGALKLTKHQFFRPDGESTQLQGAELAKQQESSGKIQRDFHLNEVINIASQYARMTS